MVDCVQTPYPHFWEKVKAIDVNNDYAYLSAFPRVIDYDMPSISRLNPLGSFHSNRSDQRPRENRYRTGFNSTRLLFPNGSDHQQELNAISPSHAMSISPSNAYPSSQQDLPAGIYIPDSVSMVIPDHTNSSFINSSSNCSRQPALLPSPDNMTSTSELFDGWDAAPFLQSPMPDHYPPFGTGFDHAAIPFPSFSDSVSTSNVDVCDASSQEDIPSHPSIIPAPQARGTTLRRRGPDCNSIQKRRKRPATFNCDVSGCQNAGFTTLGSLKRHTRDKHSRKECLFCSECGHAFADSTSVGRHERGAHNLRGRPLRHEGSIHTD